MNDSMKVGVSLYHGQPTKYIVFTICAIVLIRVLHTVLMSLSGCTDFNKNASKAMEYGSSAYKAYQDIRSTPMNPMR